MEKNDRGKTISNTRRDYIIYNLLRNQYVSYENTKAIELLNKMEKLIGGD